MNTRHHSSLNIPAIAVLLLGILIFCSPTVEAQTTSTKVPLNMMAYIPCADGGDGEFVALTGTLHILIHTSTDANGCVTVKTHFQPQKLSGTGQSTGDSYQGVGVTQSTTKQKTSCGDGCIIEQNFNNNFRMIGQGPGNNFMVHQNFRVITNVCTGEVTVVNDYESTECI